MVEYIPNPESLQPVKPRIFIVGESTPQCPMDKAVSNPLILSMPYPGGKRSPQQGTASSGPGYRGPGRFFSDSNWTIASPRSASARNEPITRAGIKKG